MKRSHLAHAITFTFGAAILAAATSPVLALESEHGPGDPIDPVPHCPKCAPLPAPADGDDRSMWIDTNGDEEGGKRRLADMWISFETNGKTPGQCGTNDGECDAENCSTSLTVTITNARDEDCPFLECDFQYKWDGVTQPDIPTGGGTAEHTWEATAECGGEVDLPITVNVGGTQYTVVLLTSTPGQDWKFGCEDCGGTSQ
ncbi:MAG: hypothetical protein KDA27_26980 [Candidatus Eisenbacteria bacterium]|uniref:Uncharacterized protein n=1 Tax=Eiseniibacteriota bacterium TaxID=2212470 RepID=A0A956NKH5_UNCEI|nr:hypothetical protein [Candidatus Eisenbacteria bacterium]MCB9464049.1 hypothetical protein [Candidatus Eisenbacteria bacterium]